MLAQEEAKRFHHNYVGTEHLLLGLIGKQDNVVTKVIKEMGVTPEQIRSALEDRIEYGGLEVESANIPFYSASETSLIFCLG